MPRPYKDYGDKRPPLRYFYLNGDLHKKLHITLGKDLIKTWNYPKRCIMTYNYSQVKRDKRPAFRSEEVSKMLNRSRMTLRKALYDGVIERPQMSYALGGKGGNFQYHWSEDDIMNMHAHLITQHYGHPRKDGEITTLPLPTARELRAMINQENIFYVKVGDEFVPTWKAPEI